MLIGEKHLQVFVVLVCFFFGAVLLRGLCRRSHVCFFLFVCLLVFGLEEENRGVFHHTGGSVGSDVLTASLSIYQRKTPFFPEKRW